MKTLPVDLGDRSYPIYIGYGLLDQPELFDRHIQSKQVLVVTNSTVAPLYLNQVKENLKEYQVATVVLPDGEEFKSLETVNKVFDCLMDHCFSRNATLLALGGGVIGDLGGFAAACYQRGIAFVQIPTTLLAQVDSSVGGKTGVNHPQGKNMIGAFYQPQCVIADTTVLNTLDGRQFAAGLAEVIKYGLINDKFFFEWLENHIDQLLERDQDSMEYAIEQSCISKANVVAQDEKERGLRAILNFGHTFGHAIETGMGYGEYLHGEAVAIGMCQAADLSRRMGYLEQSDVERIEALVDKTNLPIHPPGKLEPDRFLKLMAVDKKNIDGKIRVILLEQIGRASLPTLVNNKFLYATLNEYGRVKV